MVTLVVFVKLIMLVIFKIMMMDFNSFFMLEVFMVMTVNFVNLIMFVVLKIMMMDLNSFFVL